MHLLFISSNRIGDSLINLQVLNKYIRKNKKNIQITLVSGSLPLPLYDDYPNIIRRIILKKEKYNLHWWKLYKTLFSYQFDEIFDFRSSLISYFLRTKKRTIFKMIKNQNVYEQIHQKYETDIQKDCKIVTDRVRKIFPNSNYVCLAPFANWPPKEWTTENFIKVAKYLLEKGIDKIYILGSIEESERFQQFHSSLGDKVINRCGKQHILNDYGLLQKSRLFIGNDSSMMHMAALAKTPTIGLFGPTNDRVYFPKIFDHCMLVRSSQNYEFLRQQTNNLTLNNCLMHDVSYNDVIDRINTILNASNF